jgi:hypothetical protein
MHADTERMHESLFSMVLVGFVRRFSWRQGGKGKEKGMKAFGGA